MVTARQHLQDVKRIPVALALASLFADASVRRMDAQFAACACACACARANGQRTQRLTGQPLTHTYRCHILGPPSRR